MTISGWLSNNFIEIFGAITGILYVILEIRQNIWLWPVGIITSGIYILVFFTGKLYADMSLQGYYLVISMLGWYWWIRGTRRRAQGEGQEKGNRGVGEGDILKLKVTRLKLKTGLILAVIFILLYFVMWIALSRLTDSPVPGWDSFITSLSIIATWMLARKIFEHWFLWIVVNLTSSILFSIRGLYPTLILYLIYSVMSFVGLRAWRGTIGNRQSLEEEN